MSNDLKTVVEQYIGLSKPHIPSSGDAAEDYDRRNAWYSNARAEILRHPHEAMPYLIEHLEKADNLLKQMGLDALHVALPLIAKRADSRQKATQLGKILDGRVSDLFEATTSYTTSQHPDEIRQAAVYLLAALEHPMRDETLAQLAQSDSAAVQLAVHVVHGEAGVTDGDTVTEEIDGVSFTFSADLLSDLDNLKDSGVQQRLTNIGVDAVPALMYAIADKQYAVYHYVLDILDAMTDDTLPQQMEQYVQMDELPHVQAAALHTLGSYPEHPGLLTYLRQALNDATHPQVHQTALEALAEVGSADDIAVIVPHLESANGRTRTLAGLTLVDLGDMRGAPTVYMQAESQYPGVRLQAVERLPKINTKEARQHLKRLTKDDDDRVREAAKQAR